MDLYPLRSAIEAAVKQAGDIILSHFNTALDRHMKSDGSFATDADLASEKHLIETLKDIVPGAGFYAEESGITSGNEYMWVIDPLDGTTNFAQGIPYFCVSVALTRNDERLIGVIYQPITKEFFYASKGSGATLNGKKLQVLDKKDFSQAVIGCALSYEIDKHLYNAVGIVGPQAYSVRILGAAALDIAYCASNRFDAIFFKGLCWWDIAAGSLILEEAGGVATTLEQRPLSSEARSFIGGSELISQKLLNLIKKKIGDC